SILTIPLYFSGCIPLEDAWFSRVLAVFKLHHGRAQHIVLEINVTCKATRLALLIKTATLLLRTN
ncbi:hypothetical protein, partial [Thermofilum sp.]|uniref:hypothetical protein n=1 Tax=Thermofilum sp. TaxID=1961369 RepID=UPI002586A73F